MSSEENDITHVEADESSAGVAGGIEVFGNDDCNSAVVLDTIDSCVGCVEGVDLQHNFEEGLINLELIDKLPEMPSHAALSPTEAALIRLQIHDRNSANTEDGILATFPDMDVINICGSEDVEDTKVFFREINQKAAPVIPSLPEVQDSEPCDSMQCSICFDDSGSKRMTFAKLPCCIHAEETSTIKVCTSCILLLTHSTSDGSSRIGRCPRCRSWIVVATPQSLDHSDLQITAVAAEGKCLICNQLKDRLVEEDSVCDACFLGRRNPLLYECQICHVTQRIPHPMYRYQRSPEEFGTVTWACQGRCAKFTTWRIKADQVALVPVGDAPEEWGSDYLEIARSRVLATRRELVPGRNDDCQIL